MFRYVVCLGMLACSPVAEEPWSAVSLEGDWEHTLNPPPPGPVDQDLLLTQLNDPVPGGLLQLNISGAEPGQALAVVFSAAGEGAGTLCPAVLNHNCVGLLAASRSRIVFADGLGEADIDLAVPSNLQHGDEWWFQAAAARGPGINPNLSNIFSITDFDLDGDGAPLSTDCDDEDPSVAAVCDPCFPDVDLDGDGVCDVCPLDPAGSDPANLLINAGFTNTECPWYTTPGIAAVAHEPTVDRGNDPASGSLEVQNLLGNTFTTARQCLPVTPGTTYRFGGYAYLPGVYAGATHLAEFIFWANADCSGSLMGFDEGARLTATDTWTQHEMTFTAPAGAAAVWVGLGIIQNSSPANPFIYVDDTYMFEQ